MHLNDLDQFGLFPVTDADHHWIREFISSHWGSPEVVVHGTRYLPESLPGCKALMEDSVVGLITWTIAGSACEIVSLNSLCPHIGVGAALLDAAESAALKAGCENCWLVTTNDNLEALQFYQGRGYCITRIERGVVDAARKLKPSIPLIGENGISISDELTLSKLL